MIFDVIYRRMYKKRNVTSFQLVQSIDETHMKTIFFKWAKARYKKAFIKIINIRKK